MHKCMPGTGHRGEGWCAAGHDAVRELWWGLVRACVDKTDWDRLLCTNVMSHDCKVESMCNRCPLSPWLPKVAQLRNLHHYFISRASFHTITLENWTMNQLTYHWGHKQMSAVSLTIEPATKANWEIEQIHCTRHSMFMGFTLTSLARCLTHHTEWASHLRCEFGCMHFLAISLWAMGKRVSW